MTPFLRLLLSVFFVGGFFINALQLDIMVALLFAGGGLTFVMLTAFQQAQLDAAKTRLGIRGKR